jgi:hypothetical protein
LSLCSINYAPYQKEVCGSGVVSEKYVASIFSVEEKAKQETNKRQTASRDLLMLLRHIG